MKIWQGEINVLIVLDAKISELGWNLHVSLIRARLLICASILKISD